MNVLQVITDTDRRGAQVFAVELGDRLGELGADVETVALTAGDVGGVEVSTLGSARFAPAGLAALRRRIRRADVVTAHGSSTLPAAILSATRTGTPIVYRQISDPDFWAPTRRRRMRVRAYYRSTSHVVALSPSTGAVLSRRFGVEPTRITVIPNAVDERRTPRATPDDRLAARRRFGLDAGRPLVGYVGALVPEKGVADLVDALPPGASLIVAGEGTARAALERQARERRVDARFLGRTDDPWPVYAASDVVALPSRGGDTQPAVLIEASLVGTPCVATSVGAVVDIVQHGRNGVLVEPLDVPALTAALADLLGDQRRQARLGHQAAADATARFTMTVVTEPWYEVLDRVRVKRARRRPS